MKEWKYGQEMLNEGYITSLSEWSDEKEMTIGRMDTILDYLWYVDNKGVHFTDRGYHSGIEDAQVTERRKNNELELHFDTLREATHWLNKKLS